jgi:putative DNA methylase
VSEGVRYPKRLIEVDLPIKRISRFATTERSIRHGHISTLHIWWARRPLASCRAVICAALWLDPVDPLCPPSFLERVRAEMLAWASHERQGLLSPDSRPRFEAARKRPVLFDSREQLRGALLDFIADFSNWDNAEVRPYIDTSRALTQAAHEAVGGTAHTRPLVVDPFAGGGSIPLEALRVGAGAFASDLNPVPVLLNRVVLEYIPKYGQALVDETAKWAEWIRKEAEKRLASCYPRDPDGAVPIAFLWARTVLSEAPSADELPVQVPLLRTLWLSKRRGFLRALRWARNAKGEVLTEVVDIELNGRATKVRRPRLEVFTPSKSDAVEPGTAKGGSATCPVTSFTTSAARVKEQLKTQRGGAETARLYAIYVEGTGGRDFRVSTAKDAEAFQTATLAANEVTRRDPNAFPTETINPIRPHKNTRGLSAVTRIGCATFGDLYNRRQAFAIHVFYDVLRKRADVDRSADREFLRAVQTILALAVDRAVSQNTSMSRWDASRLTIKGAFSKQALAVVWDFAEANPFSGASADWDGAVEWVSKFIEANAVIDSPGTVSLASATSIPLPSDSAAALITDPPYFAAIPYGDLSDFFYVWLRRGLGHIFSDIFANQITDKTDELIVTNAQCGRDGQIKDDAFFRGGMTAALRSARQVVMPGGIGVVVYAEGTTAGWEAILGAIVDSGWIVTSSWPIDTEMANRTQAHDSASLQSSIHIVCRPREERDGSARADQIGDWREVLNELPIRIHEWMPRLAAEGVVGADAIFACLGPAFEIFSRYSHVERASGEAVTLKEYLEHVWAAVAREALSTVLQGGDSGLLEPDARLAVMWLWTLGVGKEDQGDVRGNEGEEEDDDDEETAPTKTAGGYVLEFDAARKIAQGLGAKLEELTQLVAVKGDKARLLPVSERATYLFGKADAVPVGRKAKKRQQLGLFAEIEEAAQEQGWGEVGAPRAGTTTLDRVNQAMLLFASGRSEALKRFLVEDGVGQQAPFWKLAQALSALYPGASDEKRWVDGVLARKKGLGFG